MLNDNIFSTDNNEQLRSYSYHLYRDIEALEEMLHGGLIEKGITRIGAEQELCLLDPYLRPTPLADSVLSKIEDERINHELAKYNLEINLTPLELKGDCFTTMRQELTECLGLIDEHLQSSKARYILTGIPPTMRPDDIGINNMTEKNRYFALNDSILKLRGGSQNVRIDGLDELISKNNSVMFESCNTSFQIHFQVDPSDFCQYYNWSQAIAGPVLAACCNSPLFLGKRLWLETRIALFRQAAEVRSDKEDIRERKARVFFGSNWCKNVLEIFRDNLARHRPLVVSDQLTDSINQLKEGTIPKLNALTVYNSTIYQWNRVCYGTLHGRAHLRIENRYIPSGPSISDEIANTAFWVGLMNGLPEEFKDLDQRFDFDSAKSNFINAAKTGLETRFRWIDDKIYIPEDLIIDQLLPIAEKGLLKAGIDDEDIQKNLRVIKNRVLTGKTGARWMLDSFNTLKKSGSIDEASLALTAAILKRQDGQKAVHQWPLPNREDAGEGLNRFQRVEQIMSRDLFTIGEEDLIDIAPNLMVWKKVRYLLVENDEGDLVGLVTLGRLGRYYSLKKKDDAEMPAIKTIMTTDLTTVTPETSTVAAIELMQENDFGCLPVLDGKKPVGILTEKDFLPIGKYYLERMSEESGENQ